MADAYTPQAVKTKTAGDVIVKLCDATTTTQQVSVDASGRLTVNVNGTVTVSGTVTANAGTGSFNDASDGATGSACPATASAQGASDGTNLQIPRVADLDTGAGNDYCAKVNLRRSASGGSVELVGQTTMANSLPVTLASDQPGIAVSVGTPTSPQKNQQTFTALANGTNTTLNFTDITAGKTGKLRQVVVSGTVPLKIEIGHDNGGGIVVDVTLHTSASNPPFVFNPADKDFFTQAGGSGKRFAVKVTNRDNVDAGDGAAMAEWEEI